MARRAKILPRICICRHRLVYRPGSDSGERWDWRICWLTVSHPAVLHLETELGSHSACKVAVILAVKYRKDASIQNEWSHLWRSVQRTRDISGDLWLHYIDCEWCLETFQLYFDGGDHLLSFGHIVQLSLLLPKGFCS